MCVVQLLNSVSLRTHGLQHARLPCLSPSLGACSNSCPLSWWCHTTSCLLSYPSPPAFNLSQHQGLFQWVGSSHQVAKIASASASVFPMNTQGWFPLWLTGSISLQSKGLSRVFSSTTIQKHQFFGDQPSLWSNCHGRIWLLEKSLLCLDEPLSAK